MKTRLKAFALHFLISLFLFSIAATLVLTIWYPPPTARILEVSPILKLLFGVDVILGPLLTAVVFSPTKRHLWIDLTVIACFQLMAFAYGVFTLAQGRPAWVVFNVDRFTLVTASELDVRRLTFVDPAFQHPSWLGPKWVAASVPDDLQLRNELTWESVFSGVDLPQRPDLYQPLAQQLDALIERSRPLSELKNYNDPRSLREALAPFPNADAYLPMVAVRGEGVVFMQRQTGRVLGITALKPWD